MEDNQLVSANDLLPALAEQSKKIEEMREILNSLTDNKETVCNELMPLDFRKLDAFVALQQYYYSIFEKNQASLELVPFEIIKKADNWALKMFNKDLKNQVDKNFRKIKALEKKAKRKEQRKSFKERFSLLFKRKKK